MNKEQKQELINRLDTDEKKAKQFFKMAYNYDNLNNDFQQWRKHWLSLSYDEKEKIISKGTRNGDFDKVQKALLMSKGNPFKAYKLLKAMKNETKEK